MLHKLPSLAFSCSIILFATVQGAAVRGRKPQALLLTHRLIKVRKRVASTCCLPPSQTLHIRTNESSDSPVSSQRQKQTGKLM